MSLYNCKTDGDQYRISKFTNDLEVEASYLTSNDGCDCPAGHRPVCRHRIMLLRFIAKNATAGQWFHNYEHQQWIRAMSDGEPNTLGDLASAASELTAAEVDERIRNYHGPIPRDGLIEAMVDSTMKTINLLELAKPFIPKGAITGRFIDSDHIEEVEPQPKPLRFDKDYSNSIGYSPAHDALSPKPLRRL